MYSSSRDNDILKGHDIALLEMINPVSFSDSIWPACLPGTTIKIKHHGHQGFYSFLNIDFFYIFQNFKLKELSVNLKKQNVYHRQDRG